MNKQLIDTNSVFEQGVAKMYQQYRELGYYPEFSIKKVHKNTVMPNTVEYEVRVYKVSEE